MISAMNSDMKPSMHYIVIVWLASLLAFLTDSTAAAAKPYYPRYRVAPKVMIISMWKPEADVWYEKFPSSGLGDLNDMSIPSPGFSPLYSDARCNANGTVCTITAGESEINAAATIMALVLSKRFDLRSTYFITAGIAGVNPRHGTLGSVALIRYAVQVALQYEIDSRSLPPDWSTGYIAYGREYPHEYPSITYGTEVFELNANLQDLAYNLACNATLADADGPTRYRALYEEEMASQPPSVLKCDSATSDVYYSGRRLSEAFENTTSVWTNGTGVYCMSAQEDNAILEVLVRGAIEGLVDFGRIIGLRTGSNFDRPPVNLTDWEHLTTQQNGFSIAIDNIYNAGIEIVKGILKDWDCTFAKGISADNYIGDIFGSLGGHPDFGFGSLTDGKPVLAHGTRDNMAKREMQRRSLHGKGRPLGKF